MNGLETTHDARLIWRDGLEVVKDLFSNPVFTDHMTYNPHKVMCGTEQEYSEFFTGTRAFEIQVSHWQLFFRVFHQYIVHHITGTAPYWIYDCPHHSCFG